MPRTRSSRRRFGKCITDSTKLSWRKSMNGDRSSRCRIVQSKNQLPRRVRGSPVMHEVMMGFHMPQFYGASGRLGETPGKVGWKRSSQVATRAYHARRQSPNLRRLGGTRQRPRADSVTEEGWATFRNLGEAADELLKPVLNQPEPPGAAFFLQLRSGQGIVELGFKISNWNLLPVCCVSVPDHAPFSRRDGGQSFAAPVR